MITKKPRFFRIPELKFSTPFEFSSSLIGYYKEYFLISRVGICGYIPGGNTKKSFGTRPVNFLGFSSFAQDQNFSQKFWAKTQNLPKLQMYEFLT